LIISFSGKAEDWPKQKQIHILVGFAPGSTTDIVARLVAPKLSEVLGQQVVIENVTGASGTTAPVGSNTCPRSVPVVLCADAGFESKSARAVTSTTEMLRLKLPQEI
jgi:hypothetical protein